MSHQAYVGTAKRTFTQALVHLLKTQYALLGSDRILHLLAEDVQELIQQFYPTPTHLSSGWMVFTGTKAVGNKAYPGQPVSDHQLVTIPWPVCLPEDTVALTEMPPGRAGQRARQALLQKRLIRLIEHGWSHPDGPVLLTLADLSVMVGENTVRLSQLLTEARKETGRQLPTMGYYFDLGMKPTHKVEIINLYEQGLDETEIARRTRHAQGSVGRYLRDYERVKLALRRDITPEQMPTLTGLQPAVIRAYVQLIQEHHPDLLPCSQSPPQGACQR
jgi:hypothetical protein